MKKSSDKIFILLDEKDNTVTALTDLSIGQEVTVDPGERPGPVIVKQNIPYAHKFARVAIPRGSDVIKYGEVIGMATDDIAAGAHVHVHNVVGKRAEGGAS